MDESKPLRGRTRTLNPKAIAAVLFLVASSALHAQISLSTAVDLAEKSSPAVRSAQADVQKAIGASAEAKDAYVPNFLMGANPGYVYGYPLGYPSLFQATSQSLILSRSQRDYIRSARAAVESARFSLKNTQRQVAMDVSLAYVQLDHDLREIAALNQEKTYAESLVAIEQQRVEAGVDAAIDSLQAQLTAAQVDEKRIHLENDADDMRQKLAHLTGLPAAGLTTVSASIPPPPTNPGDSASESSTTSDPAVAAAYATAQSKRYQAWGDARQNFRPLVAFGAQYALFEKFANYTTYFPNGLQYNNIALGVTVTFPLFDATRRARARQSAADAVHAQADADAARNTLDEQTLSLRGTLRELAAQQRVAELQSRLAQAQLQTIDAELAQGTGTQAISPAQAQKAHIQERERYEDSLDANFALLKVQLNLLRLTGQLDAWIQSSLNLGPH